MRGQWRKLPKADLCACFIHMAKDPILLDPDFFIKICLYPDVVIVHCVFGLTSQ